MLARLRDSLDTAVLAVATVVLGVLIGRVARAHADDAAAVIVAAAALFAEGD